MPLIPLRYSPRADYTVLRSLLKDTYSTFAFSICSDVNYYRSSKHFLEVDSTASVLRIVFLLVQGDDDARFVASENHMLLKQSASVIIVPFISPELDTLLSSHPSLAVRFRINYCRTIRLLLAFEASKYICSTNKHHSFSEHIVIDHDSYILSDFQPHDLAFLKDHPIVSSFSSSSEEFRFSSNSLPSYPSSFHTNLLNANPSLLTSIDTSTTPTNGIYILPYSFFKAIFFRYDPNSSLLGLFTRLYIYIALRSTDSIDPLTCLWTSYFGDQMSLGYVFSAFSSSLPRDKLMSIGLIDISLSTILSANDSISTSIFSPKGAHRPGYSH